MGAIKAGRRGGKAAWHFGMRHRGEDEQHGGKDE